MMHFYSYRCFDILERITSRKVGLAGEGLGDGDHIGAVDQMTRFLTKDRELRHRGRKGVPHVLLLVNFTLPLASGPRICHQSR